MRFQIIFCVVAVFLTASISMPTCISQCSQGCRFELENCVMKCYDGPHSLSCVVTCEAEEIFCVEECKFECSPTFILGFSHLDSKCQIVIPILP